MTVSTTLQKLNLHSHPQSFLPFYCCYQLSTDERVYKFFHSPTAGAHQPFALVLYGKGHQDNLAIRCILHILLGVHSFL